MKNKSVYVNTNLPYIFAVIVLGGPVGWMVLDMFDSVPAQHQIITTFISIVGLFAVGFFWGRSSRTNEILKLSEEIDELEQKTR
ncbi:hypothetical protein [Weissella soli]|uniref:hypothetical protein n=1 Tax=Weissella soli TaxID=155866 RepID=UPI0035A0747D